MRERLLLFLSVSTLSSLALSTEVQAQSGGSSGRADPCPQFFENLLEASGKRASFPWSSLEHQTQRLQAALDGDLTSGSQRLRDLVFIRSRQKLYPSLEWDSKDIRTALEELETASPTVLRYKNRVIYANPANGKVLIEDPLCGCFWNDDLKNMNTPGFGDLMEFLRARGTVYDYRGFSSFTIGDPKRHEEIQRSLAKAFAQVSHRTGAISQRVRENEENWQSKNLNDAIRRFLGSDYRVVQDGNKTRLIHDDSSIEVFDDPAGRYFRISKLDHGRRIYFSWDGKPVEDRAIDHPLSHFSYSDIPENWALDLHRVRESLGNRPLQALASAAHVEPELDMSHARDLRTLNSSQRIAPAGPHSPEAYRISVGEVDGRMRAAGLDQLSWTSLKPEEQELLIRRAKAITSADIENKPWLAWEIPSYAALAERSGDARWLKILEEWERDLAHHSRGWQVLTRYPLGSAVKSLRKQLGKQPPPLVHRQQMSPIEIALTHEDPRSRANVLQRMQWREVSADDRKKLREKAGALIVTGPKERASYPDEVRGYIELAGRSSDPGWIPILQKWDSDWSTNRTGWQEDAYQKLKKALAHLERTTGQKIAPVPPKAMAMAVASVRDALDLPDFVDRAKALQNLTWRELTDAERMELFARARRLVVSGQNTSFIHPPEISAYIDLARRSEDPRWLDTLRRWRAGWKGAKKGWQKSYLDDVEDVIKALEKAEKPN